MRYLQILNGSVLALGAVMGLVLGVVCILYGVHLETEPQLRDQMPRLLAVTGLFLGLGLTAGAAFLGQRRAWAGRWLIQALPLIPLAGIGLFVLSLRG